MSGPQPAPRCPAGHRMVAKNVSFYYGGPGGYWGPYIRCAECNKIRARLWHQRKKQEAAAAQVNATIAHVRTMAKVKP